MKQEIVSGGIVVIEPSVQSRSVLLEVFADQTVLLASDAEEAISVLTEHPSCRVVVLDLALAGHSGLEFLYELRTYVDWNEIAVVVYSSVQLAPEVLHSRTWQQLHINHYIYKPQASIKELRAVVTELLAG